MTIKPGQKIRVTQWIDRREGGWERSVEGVVEEVKAEPTGSWFAHGKDAKLWLQRVVLRKADGEITTIVIDPRTKIDVLDAGIATNTN